MLRIRFAAGKYFKDTHLFNLQDAQAHRRDPGLPLSEASVEALSKRHVRLVLPDLRRLGGTYKFF